MKDVSKRIALVTDVSRRESTQAALGAAPVKCKFGETEDKLSMVVGPIIVNVGQTLPSDLPHRCHQPLFFHLFLQAATLSENIGEGKRPQHQRSPGRNPNNPVLHPLVARPRLPRQLGPWRRLLAVRTLS